MDSLSKTKFKEQWIQMKSVESKDFPEQWAKYRQSFLDQGWVKGSSIIAVEGWVLELMVKPIYDKEKEG